MSDKRPPVKYDLMAARAKRKAEKNKPTRKEKRASNQERKNWTSSDSGGVVRKGVNTRTGRKVVSAEGGTGAKKKGSKLTKDNSYFKKTKEVKVKDGVATTGKRKGITPGGTRRKTKTTVSDGETTTKTIKKYDRSGNLKKTRTKTRKSSPKAVARAEKTLQRRKNKAAKIAKINEMPGTTSLEKRLNYKGAKARAKKSDKVAVKKAKSVTPEQRKAKQAKATSDHSKRLADATAKYGKKKDLSFGQAFKQARKSKGPNATFTWKGKKYTTKQAGE